MPPKVHYSTPLFDVADIERSVKFYKLLGFTPREILRKDDGLAFWAGMDCHSSSITEPTFQKVSFVTKIGELTCGVGYYK